MAPSRLRLDPTTLLPSLHTFAQVNQFLRATVADEDSRLLSDSMAEFAAQVEAIAAVLHQTRSRAVAAPRLVDLLTVLRRHRRVLAGLGPDWRGLYEYAAYLHALNSLRVRIGQWLLAGGSHSPALILTAQEFEGAAWRTMGEGMLLIDMHEQLLGHVNGTAPAEPPPPGEPGAETIPAGMRPRDQHALRWWNKLRR